MVFQTFPDLIRESVSSLLLAAIIFFVGLLIARLVGLIIARTLKRFELNASLKDAFGIKYNVENLIATLTTIIITIYTILLSLSILGLNALVLSIIGGIILIILTLSIIYAVRDILPNLLIGLEIQKKELYAEGDTIIIDGESMEVIELNILETVLRTPNQEKVIIPNSIILKKEIIVASQNDQSTQKDTPEPSPSQAPLPRTKH